jgi:hypothetical protein
MPGDTVCLFEPDACQPENPSGLLDKNVLAKVLVHRTQGYDHYTPEACSFYDRRIFIRRDPRDLLVSGALYSTFHSMIVRDFQKFSQFMALLRAKERDPKSVSFLEILETQVRLGNAGLSGEAILDRYAADLRFLVQISRMHGRRFFHLNYEDIVERRLDPLQHYLDMPLTTASDVDPEYRRVARSKTYNDWRNWFLPEDVDAIRPRFAECMREFGYADDWDLPENPKVAPANASHYVMRLADECGQFAGIEFSAESFPLRLDGSAETAPEGRACWVDSFAAKETKRYLPGGGRIVDPHMETRDGQRVNVLVDGQSYVYTFRVEFFKPCRNVACWMSVESISGDTVACNGTWRNDGNAAVASPGEVLAPKFEFLCNLGPGVFFLNTAVTHSEDGIVEAHVHRIPRATAIMIRAAGSAVNTIEPHPLHTSNPKARPGGRRLHARGVPTP